MADYYGDNDRRRHHHHRYGEPSLSREDDRRGGGGGGGSHGGNSRGKESSRYDRDHGRSSSSRPHGKDDDRGRRYSSLPFSDRLHDRQYGSSRPNDCHHHHQNRNSSSSSSNGGSRKEHRGSSTSEDHRKTTTSRRQQDYYVADQPKDENLPNNVKTDPRGDDPTRRITAKASHRGAGRNTESFDPASTLVRPDMRILIGNPTRSQFDKTLKHDDVVIVPELFGPEDNWDNYYKLVQEITDLQESDIRNSDFISWHEGAHLICKAPDQSKTFQDIIQKLCHYFNIDASSAGTRFNWYKDSSDWKPFHHDSAAFNPKRAKSQNITVGVSFGATRELAFIRASAPPTSPSGALQPQQQQQQQQPSQQDPVRLYFPQTNNGVFTFGRDVNILWKHGVNALKPEEQDGKGRISIILWGLARDVVEEEGSPPLLGSDGHGPHASHNKNHHSNGKRHHHHNNNNKKRRHNHDDGHYHHHQPRS